MTAADIVVFKNPPSIFSNLKSTGSVRPNPSQDSNRDSAQEFWETPNWKHFCFNSEGEEVEEKEESIENFCSFLSKIISKVSGADKSESNHQSWLTLRRSNLVKVLMEILGRIVNLVVEVADIIWNEARVKLRGIKVEDLVSISILNMNISL